MSAHIFSTYLKDKLQETVEQYNGILCSASYKTMEEGQRLAGRREMLISLIQNLDDLVNKFEGRE